MVPMHAPARAQPVGSTAVGSTAGDAAETKFRQLLEFAPDAIIGIDLEGRIELANSRVETLFGYSREDLIGKPLDHLVPERFRRAHHEHRGKYFTDPRPRPMGAGLELYALRKDGSEFPCEISLSSIETEKGMIGVAAVRDVTERKEAEAEAERLKAEFFALVSHELRTPLTSIIGYVDVLKEKEAGKMSQSGRSSLEVLSRNSERLNRLVEDLLLVTQVEAGTFNIESGAVDIRELVENYGQEAGPNAEGAEVTLTVDAGAVRPFLGDSRRIAQVLDNLVSNAIKFTPPGGSVRVRTRESGGEVLLEVCDTGSGIEPVDLEMLFDRFYRSSSANRDQVRGVGLGLSIVKAIVESHGGSVDVKSEVGVGSTFTVRLPMVPCDEPIDSDAGRDPHVSDRNED